MITSGVLAVTAMFRITRKGHSAAGACTAATARVGRGDAAANVPTHYLGEHDDRQTRFKPSSTIFVTVTCRSYH